MPTTYQFEPSARAEYLDAIHFYAVEADDAEAADRFVAAIDSAIEAICAAPVMWRVVESPEVRKYVLRRFPFVIYYQYRPVENLVFIYAVMHTSRQPDYWFDRLPPSS